MKNRTIDSLDSMAELLSSRVGDWEIFNMRTESTQVEAKGGEIECRSTGIVDGIALRVIKSGRMGFSCMGAGMDFPNAIDNALSIAEHGEKAANTLFASGNGIRIEKGRYLDLNYHGIGKKEMKDAVVECSTTASRLDKRIKNVRKTTFSKTLTGCRIINSRGVDIADERSDFSLIQEVIADDERDSVTSWDFGFSHLIRDIDPMSVGINSAKRSLELLGGKREQTGDFRAVFSNLAAAELAGVLSKSFLSESVHKNKSLLKGKLGERIFSDKLTIRDNGVHPSGWNLFAFDGEGISPVDTLLVDRGILSGFLYDLYYAQIFGKESTGNSNRDDYTAAPSQGVTNFFIDPGTESLDNLINEMDNGLIITGLLGVHTSNPITGEFSLGAEGHRVINGEKHYPIRGITISGNIFELFKNIVMVGNDIRFMGRYGSPSLLVQKITVGGE